MVNDKLEKVKAEIERRKKLHEKSLINPIHKGFGLQNVIKAKISELTYLHSFIDSMQEEPKSFDEAIQEGDDVRYNEDLGCRVNLSQLKRVAKKEATGKLKECIDNITDESLAKARKQLQEESQVCMYSTANYTNADRLTLCKDCKELCRYNQKTATESLCISQEAYDEIVDKCLYGSEVELVDGGDLPKEEPVSEDLEQEINAEWNCYSKDGQVGCINRFSFELIARHFANWQKQKDSIPVSEDLEEAGKEWLKPQLDKSYANYGEAKMMELTHFDGYAMLDAIVFGANWQKQKDESKVLTEEQCRKIRDDAFELGKDAMKQQLMAKAVDATVHIDAGGYPYIPQMELYDYDKDIPLAKEGEKVKVIVIKED